MPHYDDAALTTGIAKTVVKLSLVYILACIAVDGASKILCSYNINNSIEQYQHVRKYIAPLFSTRGANNIHERTVFCLYFIGIFQILSSFLLTRPAKVKMIALIV